MATLARRNFTTLLDEVKRVCGGVNYDGYAERAQQAVWGAYLQVATQWHHYNLHAEADQDLAQGEFTLTVPSDSFLVAAVIEIDVESLIEVKILRREQGAFVRGNFAEADTGQPESYGRWGQTLYLNRISDAARKYRVLYYTRPTRPDFEASVEFDTDDSMDDGIYYLAVARCALVSNDPNTAGLYLKLWENFMQGVVLPPISGGVVSDIAVDPTTMKDHGGKQT